MAAKQIANILSTLSLKLKLATIITVFIIAAATSFQAVLVLAIQPFLSIFDATAPTSNINNFYYELSALSGGILSPKASICIVFSLIALTSMVLRLGAGWINGNITSLIGIELASHALINSLNKPYVEQKKINTAHKISDIQKIQSFSNSTIAPLIQLIASSSAIVATTIAAAKVSFIATTLAFSVAILIFWTIAICTKNMLKRDSIAIVDNSRNQVKLISESFGGLRDLILEGRTNLFINQYLKNQHQMRAIGIRIGFLQTAPRYLIEGVGFSTLGAIGLIYLVSSGENKNLNLGVLASLALSFQIILPNLQQIFNCWTSIRSNSGVIEIANNILTYGSHVTKTRDELSWPSIREQIRCKEKLSSMLSYNSEIKLSNVSFGYLKNTTNETSQEKSSNSKKILNNISLSIERNDVVGIAGKTGSGKSTLIDIICGLVAPDSGEIYIDKKPIFYSPENRYWWLNQVSYVPQDIFLSDSSIKENILLGVSTDERCEETLEWACETAQAAEFIQSLPMGLETTVGEAGVQLSGGQRQRIGLARALYKKRPLLILDEATSALDVRTEEHVIKSIINQPDSVRPTVIMIAHRLSTLKECNKLIVLENGRIALNGNHSDILNHFNTKES